MLFKKMFDLVSAAEFAVAHDPGSLQTAKILIRLIVDVGKHGSELRKSIHAVNAEVNKVRGEIEAGEKLPENCRSGSGSFRNTTRSERAKSHESYREPISRINSDQIGKLSALMRQSEELQELQTLFRQIVSALGTVRESFIAAWNKRHLDRPKTPLIHSAESAYHADLVSMLISSQPCREWGGRLADKHHFDGIHGHVLRRITATGFRLPREPREKTRSLRGSAENRRISDKRGQECWSHLSRNGSDYVPRTTLKDRLRVSQTRSNSRLYGFWRRITETRGDFQVYPAERNVEGILNALRFCREHGIELETVPTLKRLRNVTFASGEPGFREYVLTRPETIAANLSLEWNTSENQDVQAWHNVRFTILRVFVAPESGNPCWEYGFGKNPDLPEQWQRILARVQPVHVSESGVREREPDESLRIIVRELRDRLRLAINPPYAAGRVFSNGPGSGFGSPQNLQAMRRTIASYVRKIRRIPVLSLQDSYNTGNCAPGTSQFCRDLQIETESISGSELARKWKFAKYPLNSLFLRVVDSVLAKSAESVG